MRMALLLAGMMVGCAGEPSVAPAAPSTSEPIATATAAPNPPTPSAGPTTRPPEKAVVDQTPDEALKAIEGGPRREVIPPVDLSGAAAASAGDAGAKKPAPKKK